MIRNYFVTALRTLLRNRTYALLNVAGLSVGITACILIFLLLRFELSFDNFHDRPDRIYRVATEFNGPEGKGYTGGLPDPVPTPCAPIFRNWKWWPRSSRSTTGR
jgi:hypothetical protein